MRPTKALLILFMMFSVIMISCNQPSREKEILASRIQYDVPVASNDPQLDWWINNIEGSKREPFLKRIVEAAEKGEVRVFDYFNSPLSPEQVLALGTDTIYQTLLREYPPYEEFDTTIIQAVTFRDITKIRFLEEWNWDPASLQVEKHVIAIGPVIQKEIAGEAFNQLLFWIYLDERYPEK